jgi:hypothetical protein
MNEVIQQVVNQIPGRASRVPVSAPVIGTRNRYENAKGSAQWD